MRKVQMYGKTRRTTDPKVKYYLYEKIDGSNLGIAKINGELIICQRNNIIKDFTEITYKGLEEWLTEHGDDLLNKMNDNTILFGEWLEHNRYNTNIRFWHFASSLLQEGTTYENLGRDSIKKLNYIGKEYGFDNVLEWKDRDIIYDLIQYIKPVPFLAVRIHPFTVDDYDKIYDDLIDDMTPFYDEPRFCEGFVMVDYLNNPLKIVYNKRKKKEK